MYDNQKLYENIHAMVNHRKVKIGEVESAAGVSQGYLIRSQKANTAPTIATVAKLAEILDCPMDALVTADFSKYTSEFFCLNEFIDKLIDKTQLGELVWSSDEKAVYHAHLTDAEDVYLAGAPVAGAWKKFSIWFQSSEAAASTVSAAKSEASTDPSDSAAPATEEPKAGDAKAAADPVPASEPEKLIAYSEDTNKDQYTFLHVRELIKLVKNVIKSPIDQKALVIMKEFLAEKAETPVEAPGTPSEPVSTDRGQDSPTSSREAAK